jgi:hypothetical protein
MTKALTVFTVLNGSLGKTASPGLKSLICLKIDSGENR